MTFTDSSCIRRTRRQFLQTCGLAGTGLGFLANGSQRRSLQAAEPIARNGEPFFKLSLAAYSFRNQLTRGWPQPSGKPGTMTLLDFLDFCAEQNLEGTELTGYYFPNPLTDEELLKIKGHAFRLGLDISGTAIGNDFCLPEGPEREAQLASCRQWIDFAARLGAPVIRIFAGRVPRGLTQEEALKLCISGINQSLEYAAEKGVVLALENHGGITSTPEQLLEIVRQVTPSPWFGVNFDSGNFYSADPYAELEQIAPYAVNAQIKATVKPQGQSKQPADYRRLLEILRSSGYRGYLVLEYEEADDPRRAIPEHLKQLRELISDCKT